MTFLGFAVGGAILGPLVAAVLFHWFWRVGRRRVALSGLVLFLIAYGLAVWAFLIEPKTLVVRRVEVVSPRWSGAPLRIGVISDTHVGAPHMDVARMRSVVARMNGEAPDIVVLLGDYAGGHEPAATRAAPDRSVVLQGIAAFEGLRAPLGVVGIIGNHDAWYDEPAIEQALLRAGVRVANNSAVEIDRPGSRFWVAGLADLELTVHRTSIAKALAPVPSTAPVILLTHFPDPFRRVPPRVALTLAGHTHCGQVNLPVLGRLVHASRGSARWPCGLYRVGTRQLFVTGGVGVSILPVRFRAPPEIAVVTLKSEASLAPGMPAH